MIMQMLSTVKIIFLGYPKIGLNCMNESPSLSADAQKMNFTRGFVKIPNSSRSARGRQPPGFMELICKKITYLMSK